MQAWCAGLERQAADPAVPASVQRAILAFVGQELVGATAALTAELAEQRQESADLVADNERQAANSRAGWRRCMPSWLCSKAA